MELEGIQIDLVECCITKGKRTTLFNPCGCWLGSCDIDLMFPGCGNLGSKTTHDILFLKYIDKSLIILNRNKITAIGIYTFLHHIADLTEVWTKCCKHCLFILVRCSAFLLFSHALCIAVRLSCDRGINRLWKFLLPSLGSLLTLDGISEFLNLSLHLVIGCSIFSG